MKFVYELYGLRVVTNWPRHLAQSLTLHEDSQADILLTFSQSAPTPTLHADLPWHLLSERHDHDNDRLLLIWSAELDSTFFYKLTLSSVDASVNVLITKPSDQSSPLQIEVYWEPVAPPTPEDVQNLTTWVFDIALGYAVRLLVPANLHGSALAIDGRVIVLLGNKGAGKSTLTAAMVRAGMPMLADDHVAIWPREGEFWVEPGAPRLRLWPTSLPVIGLAVEKLPRLYSFQEKRLFSLSPVKSPERTGGHAEFQSTALPLGAIYLLEPRDPERHEVAIVPTAAKVALHELMLKRFGMLYAGTEHARAELTVLAQVAQSIPIRRTYRPDGLTTLSHLIQCLAEDFATQVNR